MMSARRLRSAGKGRAVLENEDRPGGRGWLVREEDKDAVRGWCTAKQRLVRRDAARVPGLLPHEGSPGLAPIRGKLGVGFRLERAEVSRCVNGEG